MEQRVDSLLTTLAEHKIPAPPEPPRIAASSSIGHVVVGTQEDPSAAHISLSFPAADNSPIEISPRISQPSRSTPPLGMLTNFGAGFLSENMQQTLLKDPRVGIDFILAYVFSQFLATYLSIFREVSNADGIRQLGAPLPRPPTNQPPGLR